MDLAPVFGYSHKASMAGVMMDGGSSGAASDWPADAESSYERIEILGKGSYGMVWMARRLNNSNNNNNNHNKGNNSNNNQRKEDEYVAIKAIHVKDDKAKVYAEREICILQELQHPNIIRLIKSYPAENMSRVVVLQLARGPNLHQLVIQRGAIGLPLVRLLTRQLIAAVSYLHGRAVIHRDIKPSNCMCGVVYISIDRSIDRSTVCYC
jgi:mitogen-activated protein kinase 15